MDIEVTVGMITLEEAEVGLKEDNTQASLGEMIEAVVDQDMVQEQVLIEIGSHAISIGSMIICQRLSKYIRYRKITVRADTGNA